jgi:hypothetical protein
LKFSTIILLLLLSCSHTVEPTIDISGRYYADGMLMLLNQQERDIKAVLEWQGGTTNLMGLYDVTNNQVMMSSDRISFDLIYGADRSLRGGYNIGEGSKNIAFEFINRL